MATAIQAHLQQRMDSIAIMKCLGREIGTGTADLSASDDQVWDSRERRGNRSGQSGADGVSAFSERVFPYRWPRRTLILFPRYRVSGRVLTVLLFTVPPLLGIRRIRPALIFRSEMAAPSPGFGEWWKRAAASVVSAVLILAFVGLLAAWLSDNAKTGIYFAIAIAVGLVSLAIAWVLLRGLRSFSRHLPRSAGPVRDGKVLRIFTGRGIMREPP